MSVAAVTESVGFANTGVMRSNDREELYIVWLPNLTRGVLQHASEVDQWKHLYDDDNNLMLHFESDGHTSITSGDGDLRLVETTLQAGDELDEFLEFFLNSKAAQIGTSAIVSRSLKSLFDGHFLLVTSESGCGLIPISEIGSPKIHPEVNAMIDAFFTNPEEGVDETHFCDLGDSIDHHKLRESLPPAVELLDGDIIIAYWRSIRYAGLYKQDKSGFFGSSPALVLRPHRNVSRMWITDFLQYAIEADGLLDGLLRNWRDLNSWLAPKTVRLPSLKRDQIAASITRRQARWHYVARVRSLTLLREPFDKILPLFRKRSNAVTALHSDLLDDLVAAQQPLPFFLEYPYRHFRREDDHLQRVRAGQRLLGILAKIPLYLVVEELLAAGHYLGSMVLDKLEERPPSDGTLVALQKQVAADLASLPVSPLSIFACLQSVLMDTSDLECMVTARNRMHHEPFDEAGFLATMEARSPHVMETLRTALQACRFIVPRHGKVLGDNKLVTAEDVCSADAHFRVVELKVALPLENFPSGELIVFNPSPEQTLQLGNLLTSKLVTQQSRDFGVFDRMRKKERHFTFLRSE